jgi:hypothetical protein
MLKIILSMTLAPAFGHEETIGNLSVAQPHRLLLTRMVHDRIPH